MTCELSVQTASRPDVALYPPGVTFGPRTLSDYEFVWLLSGSAEWIIGAEEHHLHPGVLSLARPGSADMYRWDPRGTSTHAYVHFTLAPAQPAGHDAWPRVRELSATNPMASLCRHLLRLGAAPASPDTGELVAQILTLLVRLFLAEPLPASADVVPDDPHVLRLRAHLRDAWSGGVLRPISVGELADAAGLSTGYLSRLVRQRFGVGPARAVELLRLGRAAGLLDRSNLPVATVASVCGYADAFHFSKRFHATYELSPRAYRAAGPHDDPWAPVGSGNLLGLAQAVLLAGP